MSRLPVAASSCLVLCAPILIIGPSLAHTTDPRAVAHPVTHPVTQSVTHLVGSRGAAVNRLRSESTGPVRLRREAQGDVRFVGADAGVEVVNPGVDAGTSVRRASRLHLERYARALGVRSGALHLLSTRRSVAGQTVVRYAQRSGGLPVIGGQVVVSLRPDRQLGSMLATVARPGRTRVARVRERVAARSARAVGERYAAGRVDVTPLGRWWWSPALLAPGATSPDRSVWRFDVSTGPALRRTVLVDDRTGAVLLDAEADQSIDRVVCDAANVTANPVPCTSGFARVEGGAASPIADVNQAYAHTSEVSTYYHDIAGIDLTQLLGRPVSGVKRLASTVRLCPPGFACPYANAFWDGTQMYYGADYASADDVVGHEMTHGVISHNADLFYWGQTGAINESLADTMGEIVDHRFGYDPATDSLWTVGEDLPIGAIRSMKDPTLFGDPDSTSSSHYTADDGYWDNGGVHTDSGVANKTAYLISQGGTFRGQTITGLDGSDTTLTKTAKLYYDVIQSLSSGSDFAALGDVLDQSCQDLLAVGTTGFTAASCANVHRATLATGLRQTPVLAPQPADAPATCPTGMTRRVLFDSETGTPADKFTAGPTWTRGALPGWGANATSGHDSWASSDPGTSGSSSLVTADAVALPAGQPSYLWFQGWRLLDNAGGSYNDGGSVELSSDGGAPTDASALPWVNGPEEYLSGTSRKVFGGDSRGFVASRVNLSSLAGHQVRPRFTMNTNASIAYIGWFVDDIRVYTCDGGVPSAPTRLAATGRVGSATLRWQAPSTNPAAVTGYRVVIGGHTHDYGKVSSIVATGLVGGTSYTATVRALAGSVVGPRASVTLRGTASTLKATKARGRTVLAGKLKAGSSGLSGKKLLVQAKASGKWVTVARPRTGTGGAYSAHLAGTSKRPYRVLFAGGPALMGSTSPSDHL